MPNKDNEMVIIDRNKESTERNQRAGRREWTVPRSVPNTPMWRNQSGLPKLPIPDLHQTCIRYLRTVRHLLSPEQFAKTVEAVMDFAMGGDGQRLQDRLAMRAGQRPDSSWLIEWWNDVAYLTDPEPVVFFVSYFYAFKDVVPILKPSPPHHRAQCAVAAAIVIEALNFRDMIASETLPPDMVGGRAQCTSQYEFLFNSCRIPSFPPRDRVVTYPYRGNTHIVVMRKRRIVCIDVAGMSRTELESSLHDAREEADKLGTDDWGVGVLSSWERDKWGKARAQLLTGQGAEVNERSLEMIQSAALAVCLDEVSCEEGAEGLSARARAYWHGDGRNRFFDKTLQFIVSPSGRAGFLGEHSIADGSPTARMCCEILANLSKQHKIPEPRITGTGGGTMQVLPFHINDHVKRAIREAEKLFDLTAKEHDLKVVVASFGREALKSVGIAPDAFVQMAIQLAFYKHTGGRCAPSYEACSTRAFLYGRTETIRSCSAASKRFSQVMADPKATDGEKHHALVQATNSHRAYAALCSRGQGVDRHLLGLKKSLQDGETMPAIFTDPAYEMSRTWELSTSALSCDMFESWGFGEVVPHGFGVAYSLNRSEICAVVTCRTQGVEKSQASRAEDMASKLKESMDAMLALCKRMHKPASSKL